MSKKDDDNGGGKTTPSANNDGMVSLPQTTLDSMFADRADRAARSKEKEILAELGFDTLDKAKEELQSLRTQVDGRSTEHQEEIDNLNNQLSEAKDNLTVLQQSIREGKIRHEVSSHLNDLGFVEASYDDVYARFLGEELPEGVAIDEETGEVTGVKEALEALATEKPHWVVSRSKMTRTPGAFTGPPAGTNIPNPPGEEVYRIKM